MWKLYKRHTTYRIGRPAWWGIQWYQDSSYSGPSIWEGSPDFSSKALHKLQAVNQELKEKLAYQNDTWEEVV